MRPALLAVLLSVAAHAQPHGAFSRADDPKGPHALVRLPDRWDGPPYANFRADAHGASVILEWPLRNGMDHGAVALSTTEALAVLPPFILRALPPGLRIVYGEPPSGFDGHYRDGTVTLHPRMADDPHLEELLLHEFGHALDEAMGFVSERQSWTAAVGRDGTHVTEYAATDPREDFAESFAAWLAYRRDLARPSRERRLSADYRRHVLDSMRHRLRWFDRALLEAAATPNGRLFLR